MIALVLLILAITVSIIVVMILMGDDGKDDNGKDDKKGDINEDGSDKDKDKDANVPCTGTGIVFGGDVSQSVCSGRSSMTRRRPQPVSSRASDVQVILETYQDQTYDSKDERLCGEKMNDWGSDYAKFRDGTIRESFSTQFPYDGFFVDDTYVEGVDASVRARGCFKDSTQCEQYYVPLFDPLDKDTVVDYVNTKGESFTEKVVDYVYSIPHESLAQFKVFKDFEFKNQEIDGVRQLVLEWPLPKDLIKDDCLSVFPIGLHDYPLVFTIMIHAIKMRLEGWSKENLSYPIKPHKYMNTTFIRCNFERNNARWCGNTPGTEQTINSGEQLADKDIDRPPPKTNLQ